MPQPPEIDAMGDPVVAIIRAAWDQVIAMQDALSAGSRFDLSRRRLNELERGVAALMDEVDAAAADWLRTTFPEVYARGAADIGLAQPFTWARPHLDALRVMATATNADILKSTRFVRRSTKQLIRRLASDATLSVVGAGLPAKTAGRALAATLREHGIEAIVYKDGSRHGLAEYGEMVVRTRSAVAYNAGALNHGKLSGVEFFEVFDGADCFVGTFVPYGGLVGLVRAKYCGPMYTVIATDGDVEFAQDARDLAGGSTQPPADLGARQPVDDVHVMHRTPVDASVVIAPATMHSLTVGPNHPVLTRRGWVSGHLLREGDQLAYDSRIEDPAFLAEADLEKMPQAEDVFTALEIRGGAYVRPAKAHDLHGDGVAAKGEIEVVVPARRLLCIGDPSLVQQRREGPLVRTGVATTLVPGLHALGVVFRRFHTAARRLVRRLHLVRPLGWRRSGPLRVHAATHRAESLEASGSGLLGRLPTTELAVEGDHLRWLTIRSIVVEDFTGYVYDATTTAGVFNACGFVVKNCGWTSHDDNDLANGTVRSAAECASFTIAHPRCRRSFGARPDVTDAASAATADLSTTEAQRADQAASEAVQAATVDRRAAIRRHDQVMARRAARLNRP